MSTENEKQLKIDLILMDPRFVELSIQVMQMDQDIDEEYLVPFKEDELDDDGNPMVRSRNGDYGNEIKYVPAKYIRERCDLAFNKKWSFFIFAERRETEPFDRYSKNDDEYIDGDKYLKCIGMMVVPGLGIKMEYGIKKVFGGGESTDWKACKTDAFKKCCEAFGIYLDYDMSEDEGTSNSSKGGKGKGKNKSKVDVGDVEYSDDDLEEALEVEVTFGKYKGSSLGEIAEDDISYIEWLVENAREEDMQDSASIVLANVRSEEAEKSSRRSKGNSKSGNKSSSKGGSKSSKNNSKSRRAEQEEEQEEEEDEEEGRGGRKSSKGGSSKSTGKSGGSSKDDAKRKKLMSKCEAELEGYDRIQAKTIMSSVSISNKYPKGKTKLEEFTLSELEELAEVLGLE